MTRCHGRFLPIASPIFVQVNWKINMHKCRIYSFLVQFVRLYNVNDK